MLSIVIAAYNEEARLDSTLRRVSSYLEHSGISYEIIVVNDGSSDNTLTVLQGLSSTLPHLSIISYPLNRGKGFALRTGVLASTGELVLISDADLSTPIEEVERLGEPIVGQDFDVAIGSRALAMSNILRKQPWWRRGMGKTFNRIVKLLVLDEFHDTQCGFKLFRGELARELFRQATIDRFAFDVEILLLARQTGHRVAEIPVAWRNAPGSKVNPVTDSWKMLKDVVRLRLSRGSLKTGRAIISTS
jgi:dolichyl-phosphate beta-glucosyltransferase